MDLQILTLTLIVEIMFLIIGIWRKGVFPMFLSAITGCLIIGSIAIDNQITVITSTGTLFILPLSYLGYFNLVVALLVIYALTGLKSLFYKLKKNNVK